MFPPFKSLAIAILAALTPSNAAPDLSVRASKPSNPGLSGASLTSKWFEGTAQVQIVQMTITNTGSTNSLTLSDTLNVTAWSTSATLVTSGTLKRLLPGQAAVLMVGIKNLASVAAGSACSVTITASWGSGYGAAQTTSTKVSGSCGFGDYTGDKTSLSWHQTPEWYNEAKLAFSSTGVCTQSQPLAALYLMRSMQSGYWFNMDNPNRKGGTYAHHKAILGTNFNYDDFMADFTGTKFDAKAWVNLFAQAGAQYVVPVTKHHDGFALLNFSTSISKRSSVNYGPKVDFIGAILNAAKTYQPQMRRGTYFSMPEWYNPKYKYSNAAADFQGGPAHNPYTGVSLTYTGYIAVNDFVADIQTPQMTALAYNYDTEILWCDIGGPSDIANFAAKWLNWARDQGRQATANNRCGSGWGGDFTTPEYATNSKTVVRKWESNRGMDPFSFGYNQETPLSKYLNGEDIVKSLVDIVSKNGNLLLDIGPKGDGSIPDIMTTGLQDAGAWIIPHSESIFKTRYWSTIPGINPFRYTTTVDAFYIHINSPPSTTVHIPDPVPYLDEDIVTVVGGTMNGTMVPMTANSDGTRTLSLTQAIINADKYVWTFKITYSV